MIAAVLWGVFVAAPYLFVFWVHVRNVELLRELEEETKRRRFMQTTGRYLGWGVDPSKDPRPFVKLYDDMTHGPYSGGAIVQVYHEGDVMEAERYAIDQAITDDECRARRPDR